MILVQTLPGKRFFRVVFLLPMMITPVGVGFLFRMMTDTSIGPFAPLWISLGLQNTSWVETGAGARAAILIGDIWQWTPFMFLILLAALSNVDKSQTEAAEIDGARFWRTFRYIVLPAIWPVMAIAILIRGLDLFRIFDIIWALTMGGPGTMTETVSIYAYTQGFKQFETSYTAAMAFLVIAILTVVVTWAIRRMGLAK